MSTVVLKFIYTSGCYYKLIFSGPYPHVSVETKQCFERLKHSSRYQVSYLFSILSINRMLSQEFYLYE